VILETEVLEAAEIDFADEVVSEREGRHHNNLGPAISEKCLSGGNGGTGLAAS
jgi:hypothetical protein